MALLLNAHELSKSFASRVLFEGLSFSIESSDRIGLIGPNGAGKSTLLKILAGQMDPDQGRLSIQKGLRVGFLSQVPSFSEEATVQSTIMEVAADPYEWETISKAQELMSKLSLSGEGTVQPETLISELSGGWKKRVALARELMKEPDILLLDEPTNHLDVESILWLEDFLAQASFATVTITHDRVFLQKISNRIVELDRRHKGGLLNVRGDYTTYLELRQELLAAQESSETKLRNTLRRETEWLRRGPQARLKKQQARINQAHELKSQVDEIASRNQSATAKLDFQSLEKNPKKLIEAKGISKSYDGHLIIPTLDLLISPKSRIGLLGANGSGKSTLIRMLLGTEQPDQGTVVQAESLQVAYFEQNRESLDPNVSVLKSICPDGDFVQRGSTPVHVKSYLARFLFDYRQMELPVGRLSGGEQSRLLLARLMLKPANILVLDEPTNDLDMATLDVLQSVLEEFEGAVLLVSHDRYFLDQVSNQLLAFGLDEKGHKTTVKFADLEQWEVWQAQQGALRSRFRSKSPDASAEQATSTKKKRLSFKEQRELDGMEQTILKAESRLAQLTEESGRPEAISNAGKLLELTQEMSRLQKEIERLYSRWTELEN